VIALDAIQKNEEEIHEFIEVLVAESRKGDVKQPSSPKTTDLVTFQREKTCGNTTAASDRPLPKRLRPVRNQFGTTRGRRSSSPILAF
jgi:hypothetical protein